MHVEQTRNGVRFWCVCRFVSEVKTTFDLVT